jgi:protein SCO1
MKRPMNRRIAAFFAGLMAVAGASAFVAANGPPQKSDPFGYFEYRRNAMRASFPDVVLLTQDSQQKRFYDDLIKDKVVVVQFMFANCAELCPRTTPNLARVQRELRKRAPGKITFLSITVDPKRDTPQALKHYAQQFGIQGDWYFLTGKLEDVDLVRRKMGVYDPEDKKVEHMNVLTIGNEPQGKWVAMEALATPEDIAQTVLRVLGSPKAEQR